MNSFVKKLSASALAVGLVAGAFSTATYAEQLDTSSTIDGGTLSLNNLSLNAFTTTVLDGTVQTPTTSVNPFTVSDATGTGSGWNLSVTATEFSDSTNTNTLPEGSLSIGTPTVTAQDGATAATSVTASSGAIDNTSGVKLLSAGLKGGMGTYEITDTNLSLNLQPKDTKAGTYTSTVTFSLVTGP